MHHHSVSHIDTHMGNGPITVIGSREKDDIPGPCVSGRYIGALIENPLRRGTGQIVDAGVCEYQQTKPEQSKEVDGLEPPHT